MSDRILSRLLENYKIKNKPTNCKGLIFRAVKNCFVSKNKDLVEKLTLRLLRKKSCKGCENCEFWWDIFNEEIHDFGLPSKVEFEDGKLYHPVGHSWQCWEGDYDFEWQFEEYNGS